MLCGPGELFSNRNTLNQVVGKGDSWQAWEVDVEVSIISHNNARCRRSLLFMSNKETIFTSRILHGIMGWHNHDF